MDAFNARIDGPTGHYQPFNQTLPLKSETSFVSQDDTKSFQCTEVGCGKFFSSLSNLTRHNLIHTGEQPYACTHCDKRFNQQGNLRKHLKSHENAHLRWNRNTTDKPFKCPVQDCHRSFTVKSSLQNHMLSHQEPVPFPITPNDKMVNNQALVVKEPPTIPTYSSIFGKFDTVSTMYGGSSIKSRCLHHGCPMLFDTQRDLRSHLFSHAPGLAAEFKVMTNTILNLVQMIETWDIKSPQEKIKNLEYVNTVKQALTDYPLLTDGPTIPSPKDIPTPLPFKPKSNHFETITVYNEPPGDDASVYTSSAASTNSYRNSSLDTLSRNGSVFPASPDSYLALDEEDDKIFNQLLENSGDFLSNYNESDLLYEDISIPVCVDCKPSSEKTFTSKQTMEIENTQSAVELYEIQQYGSIANQLSLLQAHNEIMRGWEQHMIPNTLTIEQQGADSGRKRRIVS